MQPRALLRILIFLAMPLLQAAGVGAQQRPFRTPATGLELDLPDAPLTWRETADDYGHFTEVHLSSEFHGRWDTSRVLQLRIDPKRRTYTRTNWRYSDETGRDLEDLDENLLRRLARRSRCGEGERETYSYDAGGALRGEENADLFAAGTFSNLYQRFSMLVQQEEERDGRHGDDEEAETARYRHLIDSLARGPLPELALSAGTDSFDFDPAGNLLRAKSTAEENEYRYFYRHDAAGRVVSKRLAYRSWANDAVYFSGNEFRYDYDGAGRLQTAVLYQWEGDSSAAGRPAEPAAAETTYYGAADRTDSIYSRSPDGGRNRHYYSYQDSLCTRHVWLHGRAGRLDTSSVTEYRYQNGKLFETADRGYDEGRLQSPQRRSRFYYDGRGRLIEVQAFESGRADRGAEQLVSRSLCFYGDAQDAATARRYKPAPAVPERPRPLRKPERQPRREPAPFTDGLPPPVAGGPSGSDTAALLRNVDVSSSRTPTLYYVEQPPLFPAGGSQRADTLEAYLRHHLRTPPGTPPGRVVVRFIVQPDGRVTDATVLRGLSPAADAEALRLFREMPAWKPGRQNGKPVAVYYTLPVVFGPGN